MYGFFKSRKFPINIRRNISPFYCGVCNSLEYFSGKKGKIFSSYDACLPLYFLYLSGKDKFIRKQISCYFRIINPVGVIDRVNKESLFLAAITFYYFHLNLIDKKLDNEMNMFHRVISKFSSKYFKKAEKYLEEIGFSLEYYEKLHELQTSLEKKYIYGKSSFLEVSNPTEISFEKVYEYLDSCFEFKKIGNLHGRLIYIWDAAIDLTSDYKNNKFNPFFNLDCTQIKEIFFKTYDEFQKTLLSVTIQRNKEECKTFLEFILNERTKTINKCVIKKYSK